MSIAIMLAVLAAPQSPASTPPAPPPLPVANSPEVRAGIAAARACFDDRWDKARKARFAAEDVVRALRSAPGSAEWSAACTKVLALVTARMELSACVKKIGRAVLAKNDHDRSVEALWVDTMSGNIQLQALYELSLLVRMLDQNYADKAFGSL